MTKRFSHCLSHCLPRALSCSLAALLALGPLSWTAAQSQPRPPLVAKGYTTGELALLPEWCIDSQDGPYGSPEGGEYLNKSPQARKWVGLMGADFWHMHHYCRGLRNMLRLQAGGMRPQLREGLIRSTIDEFNYVIGNCGPTMPLLPEVHLKQGEVFLMLEDLAGADAAFGRARDIKPDYWPAYDRWLAVLISLKRWDTARDLVQEGLRHAPNEPHLVAHLTTIERATGKRKAGATPAAVAQTGNARP